MALSYLRVIEATNEAKDCVDDVKAAFLKCQAFLTTNSNLAIDWGAGSTPEYIQEDESGNLAGFKFSRQAVSNIIGSLDSFVKLMTAQTPSTGDHLGNINVVADVKV